MGALERMTWLIEHDEFASLGAREMRVLFVLLSHQLGDSTACWPSVARIAAMTGIDRRDVQRTLGTLEIKGVIARTPQIGQSTRTYMVAPGAVENVGSLRTKGAGSSPATTHKGGRVKSAVEAGDSPARTLNPPEDGSASVPELGRMAYAAGCAPQNPNVLARAIRQFHGRGGTRDEWETLLAAAKEATTGHDPTGLLISWTGSERIWRGVIGDRGRCVG